MMETTILDNRTSTNPDFVYAVTKLNVEVSIAEIMQRSKIIKDKVESGEIAIVPAIYDVATGKVSFSEFATANNQRVFEMQHQ